MLELLLAIAHLFSLFWIGDRCDNGAFVQHQSWEDGHAIVLMHISTNYQTQGTYVWTIDGEDGSVERSQGWPRYFDGNPVVTREWPTSTYYGWCMEPNGD